MVIKVYFKIEKNCEIILDKDGYEILKAIEKLGSIAEASEALGLSYKSIWSYLKKIERNLGVQVVYMKKGRKGGTRLTDAGKELVKLYETISKLVNITLTCVGGTCVVTCDGIGIRISDIRKLKSIDNHSLCNCIASNLATNNEHTERS